MLFWLCCVVMVCAFVFGGGTHSGFLGDVAVQLLSIPLLIASFSIALKSDSLRSGALRILAAVCLGAAFVVALQVLLFPFDIWSGGNALFTGSSSPQLAAAKASWSALSIAPEATWAAAASLIAPLAVFGAALQLDHRQRMTLCWMLLGLGAISLLLGFAQVAEGAASALRFFEVTNPSEAVGFFANRNHFAAGLNVTLVLSALWLATATGELLEKSGTPGRSILWFAASAAFLVAVVAGLALARSRACVFLAMIALIGAASMVTVPRGSDGSHGSSHGGRKARRAVFAVGLFAVLFAVQFGLAGILTRFEGDAMDDLRVPLNRTTFETAVKALPFGAGLGFLSRSTPLSRKTRTF